jgi:hypothetical protein
MYENEQLTAAATTTTTTTTSPTSSLQELRIGNNLFV